MADDDDDGEGDDDGDDDGIDEGEGVEVVMRRRWMMEPG